MSLAEGATAGAEAGTEARAEAAAAAAAGAGAGAGAGAAEVPVAHLVGALCAAQRQMRELLEARKLILTLMTLTLP